LWKSREKPLDAVIFAVEKKVVYFLVVNSRFSDFSFHIDFLTFPHGIC
jgi:hypothetical protein